MTASVVACKLPVGAVVGAVTVVEKLDGLETSFGAAA